MLHVSKPNQVKIRQIQGKPKSKKKPENFNNFRIKKRLELHNDVSCFCYSKTLPRIHN